MWEAGHPVRVSPGATLSLRGHGVMSGTSVVVTTGVPLTLSEWEPGILLSPPQCPGHPHRERPGPDVLSTSMGALRQAASGPGQAQHKGLCLGPCPCRSQWGLSWKGLKIDHLFFYVFF